jgi:hypothetical protein
MVDRKCVPEFDPSRMCPEQHDCRQHIGSHWLVDEELQKVGGWDRRSYGNVDGCLCRVSDISPRDWMSLERRHRRFDRFGLGIHVTAVWY